MSTQRSKTNPGEVVEIIGAVLTLNFPMRVPKIYDALRIEFCKFSFEVQQQLGDGIVRTIAMGTTMVCNVA